MKPVTLVDTHCHVDRYPDARSVAREAERDGVLTIAVTNLPSHFEIGHEHARAFRRVRLALGLHPLLAAKHASEVPSFRRLAKLTSYIGEIGLDFSEEGRSTRDRQIEVFEQLIECIGDRPRFVTVHSRGAESEVLDLLSRRRAGPVVFHWYSGPQEVLLEAVARGHFFSVNPAMVRSRTGQAIMSLIPRDRLLTETDGPNVLINRRPARPADVQLVLSALATIWDSAPSEVARIIRTNFATAIQLLSQADGHQSPGA